MQKMIKVVIAIALAVLASTSAIGIALADPINGPLAVHFALSCAGQQFTVVSANEPTATVHIVGETHLLIAQEATLTITFTDPQSGQTITDSQTTIFGAGHGEAEGLEGSLVTCDHTDVIEDPDLGPVTFTIVGTFFMTPTN